MKSTGIVRKVDELGRVVIPIELRRTLDIEEKDALEIYVDGEHIILKNMPRPAFSAMMRGMLSSIRVKIYVKTVCLTCVPINKHQNQLKQPLAAFFMLPGQCCMDKPVIWGFFCPGPPASRPLSCSFLLIYIPLNDPLCLNG